MATKRNATKKATRPRRESAPGVGVTDDQVRVRAYEFYEARCARGRPGDALGDWIAAERELNGTDPGEARVTLPKPRGASAAIEVRARHASASSGVVGPARRAGARG